jgi:methionine-rich copper-binding protein CopC
MKYSTTIRITIAGALLTISSIIFAPGAHAHAQLLSATPSVDSELAKAPSKVGIVFNEPVRAEVGAVQLMSAAGKVVAKSTKVSTTAAVTLSTPKLTKGRYVLRWKVVSADGHPIVSSYAFAVNTPTPKAPPLKITLKDKIGSVSLTLSGDAVGVRTATIADKPLDGTLEWRHALYGAQQIWTLKDARSSGMLPAAGTWEITARIRVSQFEERVLTGKIVLRA